MTLEKAEHLELLIKRMIVLEAAGLFSMSMLADIWKGLAYSFSITTSQVQEQYAIQKQLLDLDKSAVYFEIVEK